MSTSRPRVAASPERKYGRPKLEENERFERRRAEIVDIAADVFAERGFYGTTINDLVDATGLQRGGLYHYIESKEDLLVRIHERFIEPLLEDARKIEATADGPPDIVLRQLGLVLMRDITQYRAQVTVFLHEWKVIQQHDRWPSIKTARKDFEDIITRQLQRGVDEKVFSIRDVGIATLGFLGMFNYSYQWLRVDGRYDPEELADQFCDAFIDGIRTGRPPAGND